MCRRDLLVVERHDVAAGSECPQRRQVVDVADRDIRHDLGGGGVGRLGEQAEPYAEGDASLVRHPGELPTTDHPDDRGTREAHDARA